MSLITRSFYIAAAKASKTTTTIIKKQGEKTSFSFQTNNNKQELKKQLEEAQKIYEELKGKLTKQKIKEIKTKIEQLQEELEEPEPINYEGRIISPPIIEGMQEELEELDDKLNIPKNFRTEYKETSKEKKYKLINLPPPPNKKILTNP